MLSGRHRLTLPSLLVLIRGSGDVSAAQPRQNIINIPLCCFDTKENESEKEELVFSC